MTPTSQIFKDHSPATLLTRRVCSGEDTRLLTVRTWRKGRLVILPDWGTVVHGIEYLNPSLKGELDRLMEGSSFISRTEEGDTMAHVLTHMKAFPSVTRARKNNWAQEIPSGVSHWQIKIDGAMGELMTVGVRGSFWEG